MFRFAVRSFLRNSVMRKTGRDRSGPSCKSTTEKLIEGMELYFSNQKSPILVQEKWWEKLDGALQDTHSTI